MVKNLSANAGRLKRHRFDPWVRKIPWRRTQQPTPVFLPGEFHGQRSLVGYSPRGHKDSDTTKTTKNTHVILALGVFPSQQTSDAKGPWKPVVLPSCPLGTFTSRC